MFARHLALCTTLALAACAAPGDAPSKTLEDFEPVDATTVMSTPEPVAVSDATRESVQRGRYLVELLGCSACHTDGALIGEANLDRWLAGSSIGIAHSDPLRVERPGVVFPANLTPDVETGIGAFTDAELAAAIRGGVSHEGYRILKVMPVSAYARITADDAMAIVAYLRSLEPVRHEVPRAVPEGTDTDALYVHFGVYRSREN